MMIMAWEKSVALLVGILLYIVTKTMDYYVEKDRKEIEEAQ